MLASCRPDLAIFVPPGRMGCNTDACSSHDQTKWYRNRVQSPGTYGYRRNKSAGYCALIWKYYVSSHRFRVFLCLACASMWLKKLIKSSLGQWVFKKWYSWIGVVAWRVSRNWEYMCLYVVLFRDLWASQSVKRSIVNILKCNGFNRWEFLKYKLRYSMCLSVGWMIRLVRARTGYTKSDRRSHDTFIRVPSSTTLRYL